MARVTFERPKRPPPIRLGSSAESITEYVKTPYPTQQLLRVPSPGRSTSMVDEERVYYLSEGQPKAELWDEMSDFFYAKFPDAKFYLHCSFSFLTVNEKWELCLPHPLLHGTGLTKLVRADHIYVRFLPGGPDVREWEGVARDFRESILARHDMMDAAVEFASLGGYGNMSAWYPPKLDKDKLRSFFEGSNNLVDPGLETEGLEGQAGVITIPVSAASKPRASIMKHEISRPVLEVHAPETTDGSRLDVRAMAAGDARPGGLLPRVLVGAR
ncbi:hypothetical protein SAMD00023353_1400720 [Rosellinia necatrix]|uniref:Uncharacterized protein n=1 Tax=Rosellinia necatrix TaxID=77044 RepID=A0A1W2TCT2_ROSNE|nr:hypothetical protein SAMD00023353_1400720 [Rosellinia necatrix]